jgi:hypothetical protein
MQLVPLHRGASRGLAESNANPLGELTTEELQPVSNPEATLRKVGGCTS